jgi:hypothetical protein
MLAYVPLENLLENKINQLGKIFHFVKMISNPNSLKNSFELS